MKKCIFVSLAAILTMAAFSEAPKRKLTPQQIEDRKYRHFGGHIYQQRETKLISIANEQQALPCQYQPCPLPLHLVRLLLTRKRLSASRSVEIPVLPSTQ